MYPETRNISEFSVEAVGDEVVVFDPKRMQYHALNQSAYQIWRLSDGLHDVREIAAETYGEETPTSLHLVSYGLQELEQAGFMNDDVLISRRSALRLGISLVAGAGALPTITSIPVSVSAQAWSPFPTPVHILDEYGKCVLGDVVEVCGTGCCCYSPENGREMAFCRKVGECIGSLQCG